MHVSLPCLHVSLPCLHVSLPCLHVSLPCLHVSLPCLYQYISLPDFENFTQTYFHRKRMKMKNQKRRI
jgi:hypothetical protein